MSDVKPFRDGESLTICHVGGQRAEVFFGGIFGNKWDQAYVRWPLAGEYRVRLEDGRLHPKKVSLWRVGEHDLERLRCTSRAERQAYADRVKAGRFGASR